MSDQPVADAATWTTRNKHNRRTSMPSVGFEPAIPAMEKPQTHANYLIFGPKISGHVFIDVRINKQGTL